GPASPGFSQTPPEMLPNTPPVEESTTPATVQPALLAGPKVSEAALGGKGSAFGRRRASRQSLSIREWLQSMEELSLTIEQRSEIQSIVSDFRQKNRDFQQAHGEEFRALRTSIREDREAGRDVMPDRLGRFRELQSRAPVLVHYQLRIWRILIPEQQEDLRVALARRRIERMPNRRNGVSGDGSLFIPTKVKDTRKKPETVGGKPRELEASGGAVSDRISRP
ncbi:MAG: hypothetical protein IH891_09730, partial [Planctomycetes bacterium]|nr:hypothetical protein [Planctomycetota bacterium]